MTIHPTALVSPEARLADDVEIGPFTIVGPRVEIGPGCRIGAHAILENRVVLGERSTVGHGSILGAAPQDLSFDPGRDTGVHIGAGNTIREYVTVHRATREGGATTIGNDCFLMNGIHVGHDCVLGDGVIMANNVLLAGHVRIDDRAFLGGGSVFHQFMRVGTLAMVRGGCRFSKNIAPFLIGTGENRVAGINAIGLRRAGFDSATRQDVKRAFRLLYTSGLNVSQALEQAASQSWSEPVRAFFDFVRDSRKRGLCDYTGGDGGDNEE